MLFLLKELVYSIHRHFTLMHLKIIKYKTLGEHYFCVDRYFKSIFPRTSKKSFSFIKCSYIYKKNKKNIRNCKFINYNIRNSLTLIYNYKIKIKNWFLEMIESEILDNLKKLSKIKLNSILHLNKIAFFNHLSLNCLY